MNENDSKGRFESTEHLFNELFNHEGEFKLKINHRRLTVEVSRGLICFEVHWGVRSDLEFLGEVLKDVITTGFAARHAVPRFHLDRAIERDRD